MRLLVLTHTFPPSRHSNAKRPFYVVRGFLEAGWQVDVLTSPYGMESGAREALEHPSLRVFRFNDPIERVRSRIRHHPALFQAFAMGTTGVMWPDAFVWWAVRCLRMCRQEEGNYDRALVFILPASLLLSGRSPRLAGAHWTFDYQESITPQYRRQTRRSPLQRLLLPLLTRLERRTLHRAGRVIFTAQTNRRTYIQEGLVPEGETTHIPYFFDAKVFRETPESIEPEFQVCYYGSFDWRGARSPETFFRALARFLRDRPEAGGGPRFVFHGNWLPRHNRLIEELNLRDVVSIQASISYERYLEKLKRSPVLLLVVAPEHNLFMPSKIVDYFGARRPILAFVPRESEMRRVLQDVGMGESLCDPGDEVGGAAALEQLWQRHRAGTLACDASKTARWSSEVLIPRYIEVVTSARQSD